MKIQIRRGVFETNSSSSHSACIQPGEAFDKDFDADDLRNGVVNVEINKRGYYDDRFRYYRPESILGYIVAVAAGDRLDVPSDRTEPMNIMPFAIAAAPELQSLVDFVGRERGAVLQLVIPPNEQAYYSYDDEADAKIDWKDETLLKRLLFNSGSYLETMSRDEHHNDYPPEYIETDLGFAELTLYPGEGRPSSPRP